MKIGLPRALLHHYYYPFWQNLFQELGAEVAISDISSKNLIQKGIKLTVPEICLPIKIFNAHVVNLLEQEVDYIFIPRFEAIGKDEWCCPKFLGLPELVKYTIAGAKEKMVVINIKGKREDLFNYKDYTSLLKLFHISPKELKAALTKAKEAWLKHRQETKENLKNLSQAKDALTLGILGYVYNIYDPFISLDVLSKLQEMKINVITFDMLDEKEIKAKAKGKHLYWTFTNKLHGTALSLLEEEKIDGLIHVTAFGCGPDSILGKYLELDSEKFKIPFMTIRVDEHTGENHLQTRIEAFIDLLQRKKIKELRGDLA